MAGGLSGTRSDNWKCILDYPEAKSCKNCVEMRNTSEAEAKKGTRDCAMNTEKNDCVVRRWMEEFFGWQTEVLGWWFSVRVSSTIPAKTGERKNNVKWKGDGMRGESVDGVGMSKSLRSYVMAKWLQKRTGWEREPSLPFNVLETVGRSEGQYGNNFHPPHRIGGDKNFYWRSSSHRVLTGFQARPPAVGKFLIMFSVRVSEKFPTSCVLITKRHSLTSFGSGRTEKVRDVADREDFAKVPNFPWRLSTKISQREKFHRENHFDFDFGPHVSDDPHRKSLWK
jgi:hypothetical protein